MFFYGTRSTKIKTGQLKNVICPNCDNQTSMSYGIYGKYAHLYRIPTFPIGKENIIECNNCKQTFNLKSLPQAIKSKFEFEKQGASTPIWYFAGAILILCIIGFIAYSSAQDDVQDSEYVTTPLEGDVYSLKMENSGYYSTMKVVKVTNDSVFTIYNDFEIDSRSGVSEIDKAKNYTENEDRLTKEEILLYFEDGIIYDVDRD
jgi:hypothetical protein